MLLDLFISGVGCRKLSVTALCIGARTSTTTALRYLSALQDAGLVERSSDATDGRRSYVQLSVAGWHTMSVLLDR
jgi:DNA-binding MarR family transcriptional regulator